MQKEQHPQQQAGIQRGFQVGLMPADDALPSLAALVSDCAEGGPSCGKALQASPAPWECDTFHLVTARRQRVDEGHFSFEVRLDGRVAVHSGPLPTTLNLHGSSPLTIGGNVRGCNDYAKWIGLVAVVRGPMSDAEVCALEQFVLTQLASAGLVSTPAAAPSCSGSASL